MNFYNKVLDKKGLKRIVSWFIENYGPTRTSLLLDEFKYIGFHYAGKAGLSLGFDDLRIPTTKKNLLAAAQQQVQSCEKTYLMGRITAFERYQKLIDIWTTTSEKLKDEVIQNFEKIQGGPLASPLYMMAFSGARGNISQVRQLVGMRGLMSDSGGGIIDFPIRSNFREGLSVTEYVISCYGARKGLIDTALRTADSGYLTRRLVDVAHGIIIREIDCGSLDSVLIKISDSKNLIGRVLAETVRSSEEAPPAHQRSSRVLWRNQEISVSIASELKSLKGTKASVQVRSPLTCLSQSVCQLCYGWNLAQGRLVSLGEAVGILAAQSIGEPGTQLTMRTFHTGGIFSTEVEDKLYSPQDGYLSIHQPQRNEPSHFPTGVFRGCKIRSVHGQTAFFFFDSIQLKIKAGTNENLPEPLHLGNLSTSSNLQKAMAAGSPVEKESILNLPAQSIVFMSPGNKIGKNTLFAEISRIKQPLEKIQDKTVGNYTRGNLQAGFSEGGPSGGYPNHETEGKAALQRSAPLLAHKKVFSEIQGEVIEKSGRNSYLPKNCLAEGGLQENKKLTENAAKKQKVFIKSRFVLAGEPFVFHRKKVERTNTKLSFLNSQTENKSCSGQLPFRTGDIVFWKGKRKRVPTPVNGGTPNRGPTSAFSLARKSSAENAQGLVKNRVILTPTTNAPLEIRRIEVNSSIENETSKNTEFSIKIGPPVSTESGKLSHLKTAPKTVKKLTYSGLILLFQHQKEKRVFSQLNPSTKIVKSELTFNLAATESFVNSRTKGLEGVSPSRTTGLEGVPPSREGPLHTVGKIFQPYAAWPNEMKARDEKNMESNLDGFKKRGLNIPTQIIRKRKNKVILRHVQVHLGSDIHTSLVDQKFSSLPFQTEASEQKGNQENFGGRDSLSTKAAMFSASMNTPGGGGSPHYVKQRDLLFQLVLPISQSSSSSDIVQGLPKIEQLFEARARVLESPPGGTSETVFAKKKTTDSHSHQSGLKNQLGQTFLGGGESPPRPLVHQQFDSKTDLRNLQKRLIQEIQSVYNSQGVEIADKHLEIIVRQMTSRIRILEKGNTPFFPDDVVSGVMLNSPKFSTPRQQEKKNTLTKETIGELSTLKRREAPSPVLTEIPSYEWVLMGITKVALLATTESYISAASFQETKRVLMNSALQNRVDFFEGLKENVIVGRIIPAGTGYSDFI